MAQEDLAARAVLHSTYIGGIERGERNVSFEYIRKNAKGLRVEPGELFRFARKRSCAVVERKLRQKLERHDP